jgi:hypothetical protein
MRRTSLTLLILAFAVFAFGISRWVTLGRQIAEERQNQIRTGRVDLDLSRQDGWVTADFIPPRPGLYSVVLETQGRSWKPHPTATYTGSFEIELVDSFGNVTKQLRIDGQSVHHTNENHVHWSGLDTVTIASTGSGAWKIRVLNLRPDVNFKETTSAVILQPPPHFDVGWAGFSRGIEVALIAGLGLILLSASGVVLYFSKRNIRQEM